MKAIYNSLLKMLVLAFLLSSALASSAWAEKASNTAGRYVDISNIISRYFVAVDESDWDGAKVLMTNPFRLDYSSFGGGDPADLDPDGILKNWATFLPGFDATHHQIGTLDIQVKGDTAKAKLYGTATHIIGARVWTVVGTYNIPLVRTGEGWKLSGIQFLYKYQAGAIDLPAEAQQRMAK